jgi:hypothetical protein
MALLPLSKLVPFKIHSGRMLTNQSWSCWNDTGLNPAHGFNLSANMHFFPLQKWLLIRKHWPSLLV